MTLQHDANPTNPQQQSKQLEPYRVVLSPVLAGTHGPGVALSVATALGVSHAPFANRLQEQLAKSRQEGAVWHLKR